MSRKHLVAGRLATYLLAALTLPVVACMDGQAVGNDDGTVSDDSRVPPHPAPLPPDRTGFAGDRPASADGALGTNPTGVVDRTTSGYAGDRVGGTIATSPDPDNRIVSVDVKCFDKSVSIQVQTTRAAAELELRTVPQYKSGEYGRVYLVRESFPLEPLLPAPSATTFPWMTTVPLDGTCDDFKAQLEEVRATNGSKIATYDVRVAAGPGAN